jgi:hypothetical protein
VPIAFSLQPFLIRNSNRLASLSSSSSPFAFLPPFLPSSTLDAPFHSTLSHSPLASKHTRYSLLWLSSITATNSARASQAKLALFRPARHFALSALLLPHLSPFLQITTDLLARGIDVQSVFFPSISLLPSETETDFTFFPPPSQASLPRHQLRPPLFPGELHPQDWSRWSSRTQGCRHQLRHRRGRPRPS